MNAGGSNDDKPHPTSAPATTGNRASRGNDKPPAPREIHQQWCCLSRASCNPHLYLSGATHEPELVFFWFSLSYLDYYSAF